MEVLLEILIQIFPFITIFQKFFEPLAKLKEIEIPSIQGKITFFERKENITLFAGILIGIMCTSAATLIYFNMSDIIKTINVWGTIFSILILGILLFIIREKQRLGYGVFEFLVGALSIYALFYSNDFNYEVINFNFDFYLKIAAGLYIMVRGQDNIVKSIKDSKYGIKLKKYGIGN